MFFNFVSSFSERNSNMSEGLLRDVTNEPRNFVGLSFTILIGMSEDLPDCIEIKRYYKSFMGLEPREDW